MSQSYDKSLLDAAPTATKTQLQEGYNADLLKANHPPTTTAQPAYSDSHDKAEGAYSPPPRRAVPFWRTRKGIIIIAVAVLVVLGAVIGGAVGGTQSKKSSKDVDIGDAQSSTSGSQAESRSGEIRTDQTIAALTTILYNVQESTVTGQDNQPTPTTVATDSQRPLTTLVVLGTVDLYNTASPTASLTEPHPFTRTVSLVGEGGATSSRIITGAFPAATLAASAGAAPTNADPFSKQSQQTGENGSPRQSQDPAQGPLATCGTGTTQSCQGGGN